MLSVVDLSFFSLDLGALGFDLGFFVTWSNDLGLGLIRKLVSTLESLKLYRFGLFRCWFGWNRMTFAKNSVPYYMQSKNHVQLANQERAFSLVRQAR